MATTSKRLASYRERRDAYFREHDSSPLTSAQKAKFTGLRHYPENESLNLILEIDETGEGVGETIQLGTLNGEVKDYIRAGHVSFDVDGKTVRFAVFKDAARGRYFLPFRDGTAGEETYAVGRYLDPKLRPDGRIVVDFNLAYNPHCAYNSGWACPIPPFENITKTPIRAGEKLPDVDVGEISHT